MNCKYVSGLISDYVDGNLEEAVKAELETHFDECERCASEVDATLRLVSSLSGLGGLRSPVNCWSGVQAKIGAREEARKPWWRWALRPVVAAPAAAVMALLALLLMWPFEQLPQASDKAFASEFSYYIGAHSRVQRSQTFADPDAVFVKGELQKASLVSGSEE